MGNKNHRHLFTQDFIKRCQASDHAALTELLEFYDGYIKTLSRDKFQTENGETYSVLDEDIAQEMRLALIHGIKGWTDITMVGEEELFKLLGRRASPSKEPPTPKG